MMAEEQANKGKPAKERWSGEKSRKIRQRIVIQGTLRLETPAHFGNGDDDSMLDMPLLRDSVEDRPLLPGTSIAGALRSYLRSRIFGERVQVTDAQERQSSVARLFGGAELERDGDQPAGGEDMRIGVQSPLIVEDALGDGESHIELRDGVRLVASTRTADDEGKFDVQVWAAGTTFPLCFELLLDGDGRHDQELRQALATALAGFNDPLGGITLGARKLRGYGRVSVARWTVTTFNLLDVEGLLGWLAWGSEDLRSRFPVASEEGADPARLLKVEPMGDARQWFALDATLSLGAQLSDDLPTSGSLLIRSSGQADGGPDSYHLHARQPDGAQAPVLSGTSAAGALRGRAGRIARTLAGGETETVKNLLDDLFGPLLSQAEEGPEPCASRVSVEEHQITGECRDDLVQNRVAIDRFTGGAADTALYNEQPVFGGAGSRVRLRLRLVNPAQHEVGLLLQVLKDLWTGDLPLGGEIGVGRGRLQGQEARLLWQDGSEVLSWELQGGKNGGLLVTGAPPEQLEDCVRALVGHVRGAA